MNDRISAVVTTSENRINEPCGVISRAIWDGGTAAMTRLFVHAPQDSGSFLNTILSQLIHLVLHASHSKRKRLACQVKS